MNNPADASVKIASINEVIGSVPTFVGYAPGSGDVAVLAVGTDGRLLFSANVPDETWQGPQPVQDVAEMLVGPMSQVSVDKLFVMGYGLEGEFRALGLADELPSTTAGNETYGVEPAQGSQFRMIDHGFEGEWLNTLMPNPVLGVEFNHPEPAQHRDAARARCDLIDAERVSDAVVQEYASDFVRMSSPNVGDRADAVLQMLEHPNLRSAPALRARIGELITDSPLVRDAVLAGVLSHDAPNLDNVEYVARTANDKHLAHVSALAATVCYFEGGPAAIRASVYAERAESTRLGQLVGVAIAQVRPDAEFKEHIRRGGLQAREGEVNQEPHRTPSRTTVSRTSVPGVDTIYPFSAAPGIEGAV